MKKAFDEDLEKYWYVRTSTLNNAKSSFEWFVRQMRKDIDKRRKEIKQEKEREKARVIKAEKRKMKASQRRDTYYVKSVFEKYYWNVDRCMICWSKWILHIHHKDKNRRNNEYTNLIKICVRCHIKAHQWEKAWEILQKFYNKKINQK